MDFDLDLLAKIVCNNMGVSVRPGKGFSIAKHDGKLTITIPSMDSGTEEDAIVLRGGLCHEAVGHGRNTDFNAVRGPTPLHLAVENVLEDARIEKAAWKIYPKARSMLDKSMAVMAKRDKIKRASNQSTPAEKASIALLIRLMVDELGYCEGVIDWKDDWAEAVQCFGDETMNKVWDEAVRGYQVDSTQEVIKAAAVIVKLLQKGFENQQQQGKDSQKNEKSDKGDESGDSQSGGSGEGQDEKQGGGSSGKPDKPEDRDGEGSSSGSGGNDDKGKGDSQSGKSPAPLDLNRVNPSEFDRGDILKGQLPVARVQHEITVLKGCKEGIFVPSGDGKAVAQRLRSALAQRLLAVVEDEDDDLVESGSLASNRLVDARMGDRFVFTEPGKPGERLDTAFSLLIDMSGSMRRGNDAACLSATWAICNTLNGYSGMGLSFTVSAFNSNLYELKDWKHAWKRGGPLLGYMAVGGTETYAAVKNRLEHLVKRSEARKVLFLITDGDIGDLSSLVNTAGEMGCEIVVMMIGDDSNKPHAPYLKRFSVVRPNNIAKEMLKTVISLF